MKEEERRRTKFFGVFDVVILPIGINNIAGVITALLRHGVHEPAARVDGTKEHIDDSVASFLTREVCIDDRSNVGVIEPWLNNDGPDDMHDDDGVTAGRSRGLDELVTIMPKSEIVPVSRITIDGDIAFSRISVDYEMSLSKTGEVKQKKTPDEPNTRQVSACLAVPVTEL